MATTKKVVHSGAKIGVANFFDEISKIFPPFLGFFIGPHESRQRLIFGAKRAAATIVAGKRTVL